MSSCISQNNSAIFGNLFVYFLCCDVHRGYRMSDRCAIKITYELRDRKEEEIPEIYLQTDVSTFRDIATVMYNMIRKEAMQSNIIDVVFDIYEEMSIKTIERTHRGEEQGLQLHRITAPQLFRQWRAKWSHRVPCPRVANAVIHRQTPRCSLLPIVRPHAAESEYSTVVICSEDTDVFVLCLTFCKQIGVLLFQRCGTQTRIRLLDLPYCVCLLNGLKFTNMCRLRDCANQPVTEESDPEYAIHDEQYEDDDSEFDE
ncbi:hypothetical protein GQR58_011473 [Nymphon striatum]|nr:hypothetical protein GQR58_011473 [Nymphon striatum]